MWRNWNTCALLVGIQNGEASAEKSLAAPQKLEYRITM